MIIIIRDLYFNYNHLLENFNYQITTSPFKTIEDTPPTPTGHDIKKSRNKVTSQINT